MGSSGMIHAARPTDRIDRIVAQSYYDTVEHWKRICEANRAQIDSDPTATLRRSRSGRS